VLERCPIELDPSGKDIHAELETIRSVGPVAQVRLPGGVLAWSITGYEQARQAQVDPRLSKDARKHWTAYRDGDIGEDFPMIGWVLMDNMTTAAGAEHGRLRKLIAGAFTAHRVDSMRPAVQRIADELLADLEQRAALGEQVDLKAAYARALPAQVICDLFGVPAASRDAMLRGGEANVDTTMTPAQAAANVATWQREMLEFVESKRQHPGDDLTSDLIAAQTADGSQLSDSELVGTLHLLLATGTEPVMNLITNATRALIDDPSQWQMLHAGVLSWPDIIEETLRQQAPVAHLPFRFAVEDIELGGVTISKGDPVLIAFAALGRDPLVHGETAADFDATRADKAHFSFGHGIYRCIGSPLAMLEAEIALSSLWERFPDVTLAVPSAELLPEVTFIMNGRLELPVLLRDHAAA
jgi:cytochrome P450